MNVSKNLCTLFAGLMLLSPWSFANDAVNAGMVENADVLMAIRMADMNESAFFKAMEQQQPPQMLEIKRERQAEFKRATGLGENDLDVIVVSADLSELTLEAMEDPEFATKLPAVMAMGLKKAITMDQLQAGISVMQRDLPESERATFSREQSGEVQLLAVSGPNLDLPGVNKAYAALSPDGKTVVMATSAEAVVTAMGRVSAGRPGAPAQGLLPVMRGLANRQMQMALVLPENLRNLLSQNVRAAMAEDPESAMMMAPFQNMRGLTVSAHATESMALSLNLDLGANESANQAMGMMQGMLPMLMMMGAPPQLMQQLRPQVEGSVLKMNITVRPEDLQMPAGMMMDMDGF